VSNGREEGEEKGEEGEERERGEYPQVGYDGRADSDGVCGESV
tara:strand:- start:407 stop:535 length:129 start_codon:yes stop_codon:yes gene_type:complete